MSNTLDSIYGVYSHRHSILFEYMSFYNKKLFIFLRVRLPLEDGKTLFGELLFLSVILAVCKDGHFYFILLNTYHIICIFASSVYMLFSIASFQQIGISSLTPAGNDGADYQYTNETPTNGATTTIGTPSVAKALWSPISGIVPKIVPPAVTPVFTATFSPTSKDAVTVP